MVNNTINVEELSNFQKLLQYFVAHLEFVTNKNNSSYTIRNLDPNVSSKVKKIASNKCRTGQGYKGDKIQNQISDWCDYGSINNAKIIICIQNAHGMGYFTIASYLYWLNTPWKIMAKPDSKKEYVSALYIQNKDTGEETNELDVNDIFETPINENLKDFYNAFICAYQASMTNQTSFKNLNTILSIQTPPTKRKNYPLNLILFGPPGTGKTYNTVNKALEIILGATAYTDLVNRAEQQSNHEDKRKVFIDKFKQLQDAGQIVFTTFHQSMSYEDFVEGIKPITKRGNVTYKVKPGIFKQICERAKDTEDPFVMIIDEINRGNVSQIFGELITLIEEDKRLGNKEELKVKLPYSSTCKKETEGTKEEEEFGVPNNLYIIGTMNTADRSVEALDTALRRRFSFEEMMPKYTDEEAQGIERVIEVGGEKFKLSIILKTINQRIEVLKGREQQIGHSYLMKCRTAEDLKLAFKDKIVPLLQEYFYGDYSQIGLVLGQGFVKRDNNSIAFADGFDAPDQSEETYCLLTDSEWEELKEVGHLKKALNCLLNIQENKQQESKPNETNDNESN